MLILKFTTKKNRISKRDKNKIIASILTLSILASGTFAWQSFSQLATNEIIEKVDTPGARLHDYFNGSDKNVFIENYASGEYAPDVYARIRLAEYFEYGKNAGSTDANVSGITIVRGDIAVADTPILSDVDTWDIYDFASKAVEEDESIRTYRGLELGGEIYYMPTFNQDNTDLNSEVKGSYRDELGEVKEIPYDDYKSYNENDQETGFIITASEIASSESSHTAKLTEHAEVMSMADWLDMDEEQQIGDYWVFDTTGWAYYAKAIEAETATGLLLDGITQFCNPSEEWYYAIDVKAQLATYGDWGNPLAEQDGTDDIGMYKDLTDEAMSLLSKVSGSDVIVQQEPEDPEEPEIVEESHLVEITGYTKEEIIEMVGTDDTLEIDGLEYFALETDIVETYTMAGEPQGEKEAVLLWMAEPLNNITYTYTLLGNSTWSGSNLRTVLESVADNNNTLDELTLRVETTVESYTGANTATYDRLYPLSYEEFEESYQLTGTSRAITSDDIATYTWLRSPFMSTNIIVLHNTNGSVNNFIESHYIGTVRPVFWAEL